MKKIVVVLVLAAAVISGALAVSKNKKTAPSQPLGGQKQEQKQPEAVIIYTDSGFSPASIEIGSGTRVIFKNQSSTTMWPASGMHPTHNLYPTTGGCIGSTFDACRAVSPGDSWSFVFDIAGSWKYHDHLNPTRFGVVNVK